MVELREERRSPAADATSGHQLPAAAKKRNKNEEKTRMAAELEDKFDAIAMSNPCDSKYLENCRGGVPSTS